LTRLASVLAAPAIVQEQKADADARAAENQSWWRNVYAFRKVRC
jgi:hypothetical protein